MGERPAASAGRSRQRIDDRNPQDDDRQRHARASVRLFAPSTERTARMNRGRATPNRPGRCAPGGNCGAESEAAPGQHAPATAVWRLLLMKAIPARSPARPVRPPRTTARRDRPIQVDRVGHPDDPEHQDDVAQGIQRDRAQQRDVETREGEIEDDDEGHGHHDLDQQLERGAKAPDVVDDSEKEDGKRAEEKLNGPVGLPRVSIGSARTAGRSTRSRGRRRRRPRDARPPRRGVGSLCAFRRWAGRRPRAGARSIPPVESEEARGRER